MRKKDEMEQKVANKSIKITWAITTLAMFIIGGIQRFINGEQSTIFLIAILSTTFLVTIEHYYLSKMNDDNKFKKMISTALILTVFIFGLFWFISQ